MATFSIDLITGKPYLFSGDFTNSGMTTFSGLTSVVNGLSMVTSRQARLGGVLNYSTILTRGAGNTAGIEYGGDYSASFSNRSLVDKGYVDLKVSGSTPSWNTLTNRPAWLTGTTLSAFQLAHTHSQYLLGTIFNTFTGTTLPANYYNKTQINNYTGSTNTLIGNKLDKSTFSTYTGTTAPNQFASKSVFNNYTGTTAPNTYASKANAITGGSNQGSGLGIFSGVTANKLKARSIKVAGSNLSISGDSTSITITGTDVDNYVPLTTYQTYTGTTVPNTYVTKSVLNVYTGTTAPNTYATKANAVTGATNLGSGNGIFTSVSANKIQLKGIKGAGNVNITTDGTSITISGSSSGIASWNTLTDKPAWLSASTLQRFQTGHTHSYNSLTNKLTAGLGITIINNVISATGGGGSGSTALQLLDITGGVNVNSITSTPITWTLEFSGTSLNFTGGSRIYVQATGVYEISYTVNIINSTGSPKNVGTVVRKNGDTDITPFSSSSFSYDNTNDASTNIMPAYQVMLAAGSYVELIGFRIGTTGNAYTKAGGSWLNIKRIS